MQRLLVIACTLALLLGAMSWGVCDENDAAYQAFSRCVADKVGGADAKHPNVVTGDEGWLYFAPELRYAAAGTFWGADAARVSHALTKEAMDPLPAILDFQQQLKKAGIELLLVPVPAKVQIYPEFLMGATPMADAANAAPVLLDGPQRAFYAVLAQHGVDVLDLTQLFFDHRDIAGKDYLFCKQDTHWSSRACALAATTIKERIAHEVWLAAVPKRKYATKPKEISIVGDLADMLGAAQPAKETLTIDTVSELTAKGKAPVGTWRGSPIVLLGDSHNLIFSIGGDMLAEGAGLPEHLARELGFPVDVVAVRGSGATPARVNLLRRGDNLAGKKLVIWCFTVREFTEGQGWKKVPVIRGK